MDSAPLAPERSTMYQSAFPPYSDDCEGPMATGPDHMLFSHSNVDPLATEMPAASAGPFFADFLWTSKESRSAVGPRPDGPHL